MERKRTRILIWLGLLIVGILFLHDLPLKINLILNYEKVEVVLFDKNGINVTNNFSEEDVTYETRINGSREKRRYYSSWTISPLNKKTERFEIYVAKESISDSIVYDLFLRSKEIGNLKAIYNAPSNNGRRKLEQLQAKNEFVNSFENHILNLKIE